MKFKKKKQNEIRSFSIKTANLITFLEAIVSHTISFSDKAFLYDVFRPDDSFAILKFVKKLFENFYFRGFSRLSS